MENMILVKGYIENHGQAGFIAWAKDMPGLVVQGESETEVKVELYKSLKVKIAFDYKWDISKIETKEIKSIDDIMHIVKSYNSTKEFELQL